MRVEVVVAEWEQACCGEPFRVGDAVSWGILAVDPGDAAAGGVPRFAEEHHGQTPDDVPHREVPGIVRAIAGVAYPAVSVTGEPRSFTLDTRHPRTTPLQSVEKGSDEGFTEYLVTLDVADDAQLPEFRLSASAVAQREDDERAARRDRMRLRDAVGAVLEEAADRAEREYRGVARIARESARSAVTIEPHVVGATAVRWARSTHEEDGIGLHTGEGSWWLPATVEHARLAMVFADAAATGRVVERVVHRGGMNARLDTRVEAEDGRSWTASTQVEPAVLGEGRFAVFGDAWERVERGDHGYRAWAAVDR